MKRLINVQGGCYIILQKHINGKQRSSNDCAKRINLWEWWRGNHLGIRRVQCIKHWLSTDAPKSIQTHRQITVIIIFMIRNVASLDPYGGTTWSNDPYGLIAIFISHSAFLRNHYNNPQHWEIESWMRIVLAGINSVVHNSNISFTGLPKETWN